MPVKWQHIQDTNGTTIETDPRSGTEMKRSSIAFNHGLRHSATGLGLCPRKHKEVARLWVPLPAAIGYQQLSKEFLVFN
jgi:hypothetical protein